MGKHARRKNIYSGRSEAECLWKLGVVSTISDLARVTQTKLPTEILYRSKRSEAIIASPIRATCASGLDLSRPPRRRHGPCPEPSSSPSALVHPPLFPPLSYFGISSHHGQRTPPILHISPLSSEHSKFPSRSQGAKAAQKRERNAAKGANAAKSQTKTNEAAKNIICVTCRQTFVRPPLSHSLPLRPDPQPSS